VTILFCDVAGSTSLAEQMDPEEWTDLMGEVFDRVIQPVYQFGGTIARLQGDAVLALFGAPTAHEDDPERAILAGLAMQERIGPVASRLKAEEGLELRLRIGINTGLAVVGRVGSELKSEYTAMGDAVNLAARMEQTAHPGTVRVSEATWKLSGGRFDFEDLGPIDVKGKDGPVRAYRVLGRLDPVAAGPGSADTPLVGRAEELGAMRGLLDTVQTGVGQILIISGEAGIGKTRLMEEMRVDWSQRFPDGAWIRSRALSYMALEPHLQTRNLVTDLTSGFVEAARTLEEPELQAIGDLMRPGEGGGEENEELPRILARAVEKLLAAAASSGPLAVSIEDLHWCDESSSRLLAEVLSITDVAPVLFVLTLRPDRGSSGWTLRNRAADNMPHRFVELTLEPLDPPASLDLVAHLVDPATVPEGVVAEIVRRSDGNPFFVEEIIRAWRDRLPDAGSRSGDFTVPDSIQTLLLSRLDRLEVPVRETVQIASVIGRTFPEKVLIRVRDVDARQHLSTLQRLDIVRESSRIPEVEFAFRHALTHETVYGSILRRSRRTLHGQVADALLEELGDGFRPHAGALSHHLDQAEDARARDYALVAGDHAYRLSSHAEAAAHYRIAFRWALETDGYEELSHLVGRLGRSLEVSARYGEALEVYAKALEVADRTGDSRLRLVGLLAIARLRAYPNPTHNLDEARSKALSAIDLARSLGDRRSEAVGLNILMMTSTFSGDPADGIRHGEAALQLARDLGGHDEIAHTLNDLAWLYLTAGEPELALDSGAEAERLWRQLDNRPMLADSMAAQLYVALLACDFATTERRAGELLAVANDPTNDWSLSMHAMIESWRLDSIGYHHDARQLRLAGIEHGERAGNLTGVVALVCEEAMFNLSMGRSEVAMNLANQCIEQVEERGFSGWRAWPRSVLVRAHLERGTWASLPAAKKKDLLAGADRIRPLFGPGVIASGLGLIEAAIGEGRLDEAEEGIERVERYQRDHEVRMWRPDLHLMRAAAASRRGDTSTALGLVEEALEMIPQLGSSRLRWTALAIGADICTRLPDPDRAELFRREASAAAGQLALELPDDWRAGFRQFASKKVSTAGADR
jgi:class 3 adenylate cyclase/tetratricopeptide (TPR) repeat protein